MRIFGLLPTTSVDYHSLSEFTELSWDVLLHLSTCSYEISNQPKNDQTRDNFEQLVANFLLPEINCLLAGEAMVASMVTSLC